MQPQKSTVKHSYEDSSAQFHFTDLHFNILMRMVQCSLRNLQCNILMRTAQCSFSNLHFNILMTAVQHSFNDLHLNIFMFKTVQCSLSHISDLLTFL